MADGWPKESLITKKLENCSPELLSSGQASARERCWSPTRTSLASAPRIITNKLFSSKDSPGVPPRGFPGLAGGWLGRPAIANHFYNLKGVKRKKKILLQVVCYFLSEHCIFISPSCLLFLSEHSKLFIE